MQYDKSLAQNSATSRCRHFLTINVIPLVGRTRLEKIAKCRLSVFIMPTGSKLRYVPRLPVIIVSPATFPSACVEASAFAPFSDFRRPARAVLHLSRAPCFLSSSFLSLYFLRAFFVPPLITRRAAESR